MKCYQKILKPKSCCSIKNVIVFGILIILSGCVSIKPGGVKTGNKLYETFFVGDEGTQYFIKPLTFRNDVKDRLVLDLTFRYRNEIKDSAFVNISFINKEIIKDIDSLEIANDSVAIVFKKMKFLFSERSKKEINSRFSTKGYLADINKLFDCNNWKIVLYKLNNLSKYKTTKKTKNKINKLKFEIFMLF